jgi:hypothetical protein
MKETRREFMKAFGIALGSLVLTNCKRGGGGGPGPVVSCYEPAIVIEETPTVEGMCYAEAPLPDPTPTGETIQRREVLTDVTKTGDINPDTVHRAQVADARQRLRDCWYQLDDLAQGAGTAPDETQQAQESLVEAHRAALDDLVALDEMDAEVAEHVQAAFTEASFHAWRNNAPITCYIALPVEYEPREDLLLQADKLAEVSGDLDPATVAAVQAALARDMAFFDALSEGTVESKNNAGLWRSGEIEVSAEALEAAQFLIDLLLGAPA